MTKINNQIELTQLKEQSANHIKNKGYNGKTVNTTFVAAFPISNPKYSLLVMMENPKRIKETSGLNTSGWNAVPTAADIILAIAPQLNVQPNYDLNEVINSKIIEAAYGR